MVLLAGLKATCPSATYLYPGALASLSLLRGPAPRKARRSKACAHEAWEATPSTAGKESRACADCRKYLGVFDVPVKARKHARTRPK